MTTLRPESVRDALISLLPALAQLFRELDTQGRALSQFNLIGFGGVEFVHQRAGAGPLRNDQIEIGGELTLPPADDEIETVAGAWINELARSAGLEAWQDLPR